MPKPTSIRGSLSRSEQPAADILQRLRTEAETWAGGTHPSHAYAQVPPALLREAADEIERLRAALAK